MRYCHGRSYGHPQWYATVWRTWKRYVIVIKLPHTPIHLHITVPYWHTVHRLYKRHATDRYCKTSNQYHNIILEGSSSLLAAVIDVVNILSTVAGCAVCASHVVTFGSQLHYWRYFCNPQTIWMDWKSVTTKVKFYPCLPWFPVQRERLRPPLIQNRGEKNCKLTTRWQIMPCSGLYCGTRWFSHITHSENLFLWLA